MGFTPTVVHCSAKVTPSSMYPPNQHEKHDCQLPLSLHGELTGRLSLARTRFTRPTTGPSRSERGGGKTSVSLFATATLAPNVVSLGFVPTGEILPTKVGRSNRYPPNQHEQADRQPSLSLSPELARSPVANSDSFVDYQVSSYRSTTVYHE